jgi:hypothetical protein
MSENAADSPCSHQPNLSFMAFIEDAVSELLNMPFPFLLYRLITRYTRKSPLNAARVHTRLSRRTLASLVPSNLVFKLAGTGITNKIHPVPPQLNTRCVRLQLQTRKLDVLYWLLSLPILKPFFPLLPISPLLSNGSPL